MAVVKTFGGMPGGIVNRRFMEERVCGRDLSVSEWLGPDPDKALEKFWGSTKLHMYKHYGVDDRVEGPRMLVNHALDLCGVNRDAGGRAVGVSDSLQAFFQKPSWSSTERNDFSRLVGRLSEVFVGYTDEVTRLNYIDLFFAVMESGNAYMSDRRNAVSGLLNNLNALDYEQRKRFTQHVVSETNREDKPKCIGSLESPYVADYLGECMYAAGILAGDQVEDTLLNELEAKAGGEWYRWRVVNGLKRVLSYSREALADVEAPPPDTKTYSRLRRMLASPDNQLRGYASYALERHLKRCDNFSLTVPTIGTVVGDTIDEVEFRRAVKRGSIILLSDVNVGGGRVCVDEYEQAQVTSFGEQVLSPDQIRQMRDEAGNLGVENLVLTFQRAPGMLYRGYLHYPSPELMRLQREDPHAYLRAVRGRQEYHPEDVDFSAKRGKHMRMVTTRTGLLPLMSLRVNVEGEPSIDEGNRREVEKAFTELGIKTGPIHRVQNVHPDEPRWRITTGEGEFTILVEHGEACIYIGESMDERKRFEFPLLSPPRDREDPHRVDIYEFVGSVNIKGDGMLEVPVPPNIRGKKDGEAGHPRYVKDVPEGLHTSFYFLPDEMHVERDTRAFGGMTWMERAQREQEAARAFNADLEKARAAGDRVYENVSSHFGGVKNITTTPICLVQPLAIAFGVEKRSCRARQRIEGINQGAKPEDPEAAAAIILNNMVSATYNRMFGVDLVYTGRHPAMNLVGMPAGTADDMVYSYHHSLTNTRIQTAKFMLGDEQHWRAFFRNAGFPLDRDPNTRTIRVRMVETGENQWEEADVYASSADVALGGAMRFALGLHINHKYGDRTETKPYRGGWHSTAEEGNCGPTGERHDPSIWGQEVTPEAHARYRLMDFSVALDRVYQLCQRLGLDRKDAQKVHEQFLITLTE